MQWFVVKQKTCIQEIFLFSLFQLKEEVGRLQLRSSIKGAKIYNWIAVLRIVSIQKHDCISNNKCQTDHLIKTLSEYSDLCVFDQIQILKKCCKQQFADKQWNGKIKTCNTEKSGLKLFQHQVGEKVEDKSTQKFSKSTNPKSP